MRTFIPVFLTGAILLLSSWVSPFPTGSSVEETSQIKVHIFLHESCRISQFYTLRLKELHQEFAEEGITFIGVFPNQSSTEDGVKAFKEKYQIPFELILDSDQSITRRFGAAVTPEVVVFDKLAKKVVYQGRIDNSYFKVGKKRQVTTTSELEDVLHAITEGNAISTKSNKAVGCLIQVLP